MWKKRFAIFLMIVALFSVLSIYYPKITGEAIKNNYQKESVFVTRVIDGDTIIVNNNTEVRLLGVNTPERGMEGYNKATEFLKQFENKTIEILRDYENLDKYDRKLRYIFYDNQLINSEILNKGLGTSFMINGLKYENELIIAEDFAKENNINLWGESQNSCANCIKLIELNYRDEFFIIENICNFDCDLENWFVKDNANHIFKLNNLDAKKQEKYDSKQKIWNNNGDRFFMRDAEGNLVIFYEY